MFPNWLQLWTGWPRLSKSGLESDDHKIFSRYVSGPCVAAGEIIAKIRKIDVGKFLKKF